MGGDDLLFVNTILALVVGFFGLAPHTNTQTQKQAMLYQLTRMGSFALFLICLLCFVWLIIAFIQSDFSYQIVTQNSHTDKPLFYKIAAAWGNHEGSMLLWCLIASFYGAAFAFFHKAPSLFARRTLGVQALLNVLFFAYVAFVSNPFTRLITPPEQGMGLNPLLQDPALSFHPPILYLGYVGFSLVFSLSCAGLLTGEISKQWAATTRNWVRGAWAALTLGIALGSWWAYYELGWGGWWFWDPVENASFIPWLAATALLHSLAVFEKRGCLKSWSVLLALLTFCFCLIGTFLVRSGLITSVHAFALDPERGIFILIMMALIAGAGLVLFALKASTLENEGTHTPLSREGLLTLNNIFLFIGACTVLIGTLYPLIVDVVLGKSISVGPPYFENTLIPLLSPLLLLIGLAPFTAWGQSRWQDLWPHIKMPLLVSSGLTILVALVMQPVALRFIIGMGFVFWLVSTSFVHLRQIKKISPMLLGHMGLAIALTGMIGSGTLSQDKIMLMNPDDHLQLGRYNFHFDRIERIRGSNYMAERGVFTISSNGKKIATLTPERRFYPAAGRILSEVAIATNGVRDLYLVLGQAHKKDENTYDGWSVRAHINPFIPWIWLGGLLMALGAIFGLLQKKTYPTNGLKF